MLARTSLHGLVQDFGQQRDEAEQRDPRVHRRTQVLRVLPGFCVSESKMGTARLPALRRLPLPRRWWSQPLALQYFTLAQGTGLCAWDAALMRKPRYA